MPRVKICGITRVQDALAAAEAGADAIGFNFWADGPRYVAPDAARDIARHLPAGVLRVGVFVNAAREEIACIAEIAGLDVVQLHGDEPPALLDGLPRPVWKAFRGAPTEADLKRFAAADAFLLDGERSGFYGGSGALADTASAAIVRRQGCFVLAGGLKPENVADRIALCRPDIVDVATGVETAPGVKNPAQIRAFVRAANDA
jgi:phosphoribosylanthranilate isomerase